MASNNRESIAIIGSGPSTVFFLKHLAAHADLVARHVADIRIFEKSEFTGMGMPYNPGTTEKHNLSNISSREIPALPVSLAEWLRAQDRDTLEQIGVGDARIDEDSIYPRVALGAYLHDQFETLLGQLASAGISIRATDKGRRVDDISWHPEPEKFRIHTALREIPEADRLVIASGHCWPEADKPEHGYYTTPWPIAKILPARDEHHDFPIGTIGASLSAFDVISSLSRRHGDFIPGKNGLVYQPHPGAENFRIVMHSSEGLLPHLQFEQEKPLRRIYRHTSREELLVLVDDRGFLRLETWFDAICRPAMRGAMEKDELTDIATRLDEPAFHLADLVQLLTDQHQYEDPFEGMRSELQVAAEDISSHRVFHWKETLDDLIYTLNFHIELLPAEDHRTLTGLLLPFVMNVIAAMPVSSARMMLALHDAGKLDLVTGKVEIDETQDQEGVTKVTITGNDGRQTHCSYQLFIDCSGQKPVGTDDFPFPSLVEQGLVRPARLPFSDARSAESISTDEDAAPRLLPDADGSISWLTGGIDMDAAYRPIGETGFPHPAIHDIAFPHVQGLRPYSYGLQACHDTAEIVATALLHEWQTGSPPDGDLTTASETYATL